jgi:hypothetical protein
VRILSGARTVSSRPPSEAVVFSLPEALEGRRGLGALEVVVRRRSGVEVPSLLESTGRDFCFWDAFEGAFEGALEGADVAFFLVSGFSGTGHSTS